MFRRFVLVFYRVTFARLLLRCFVGKNEFKRKGVFQLVVLQAVILLRFVIKGVILNRMIVREVVINKYVVRTVFEAFGVKVFIHYKFFSSFFRYQVFR